MNHTGSKNKDSLAFALFFTILLTAFSLMADADKLHAEENTFLTSSDYENMDETL